MEWKANTEVKVILTLLAEADRRTLEEEINYLVESEYVKRGGELKRHHYGLFRLTPHAADAACAQAGEVDGETRGAADV